METNGSNSSSHEGGSNNSSTEKPSEKEIFVNHAEIVSLFVIILVQCHYSNFLFAQYPSSINQLLTWQQEQHVLTSAVCLLVLLLLSDTAISIGWGKCWRTPRSRYICAYSSLKGVGKAWPRTSAIYSQIPKLKQVFIFSIFNLYNIYAGYPVINYFGQSLKPLTATGVIRLSNCGYLRL